MATRAASHAGTWYSADKEKLSSELDGWLDAVPSKADCIGSKSKGTTTEIPCPGARSIITPHAGYSYSGPAAAWAYKSIDWTTVKRIFLLGPSHHYYLPNCALSRCKAYETPLGPLALDLDTMAELRATGQFAEMRQRDDEAEHSLEMQLPYLRRMLERAFGSTTAAADGFPLLTPILVGATTPEAERDFGRILAPYLADPRTVFVVSSDFCHWGTRFRYTYYQPTSGPAQQLRSGTRAPSNPKIHESIAKVDMMCMDAVESGRHDDFLDVLEETGNNVCGRHPIGVVMAAVEALESQEEGKGRFRFVKYDRSDLVDDIKDSSVSYCSAFAVF